MTNRDEVAIVGFAGRLPGGRNTEAFWSLLREGRSSVSSITPDRFPTHSFYHPSADQPGRSYTFAAGLIDDVWGFDAAAFGMSPREAEQVDPQQRHLLEVMHDALGHAGIRPSSLAGTNTGVYVGASSVDYGTRFIADPSAADLHMMTGNTLSVIANRLSYNLDLRGPSFTVDTACSSSLVALNLAAEAIRNGTVETAIVGGVNLLLSPFSFVGFSRASMLSPTGRCRPFDAAADGYVRAEGAIVLVLRSMSAARKARNTIHAAIVGSGVGQDGRTTGLSLPSAESQRHLLEQVYRDFAVDPADLVYVEAHGTGTKVGDPMEADALGKGLAQRRSQSLPIGSVKSNVGHLEPASGLAGVLKSLLVLKHNLIPATLHQQSPSTDIPFDELNLHVVNRLSRLPDRRGPSLIGVNSFGFGGTNAHVILRGQDPVVSMVQVRGTGAPPPLVLSAYSSEALRPLAAAYVEKWPDDERGTADFVRGAAHLRDGLAHRLVAHGRSPGELKRRLKLFADGEGSASILTGQALGTNLPVAFVFSGNGSQWVGMGRSTAQSNKSFRSALDEVDAHFSRRQKWSLIELLFADDLVTKLHMATYAQPLLLALQVATVRVLQESGVTPVAALGHSVGEIAAAWAAGMLSLEQAIDVVIARSRHQESARGAGRMAALMMSSSEAQRLLKSVHATDVSVAAINSWRSVSISGPGNQIDDVVSAATDLKISARRLDLDYPFHSALVDCVRAPLLRELEGLKSLPARRRFVSSVTGDVADQLELNAEHWWHNVRNPVLFEAGLNCLVKRGVRIFLEIGPRPILSSYVRDTLREAGARGAVIETLSETEDLEMGSAIERAISKVFLSGGQVDLDHFVGDAPAIAMPLPSYPWQHGHFQVGTSPEAGATFIASPHSLLGSRQRQNSTEWFSTVDPLLFPWIEDHKVGGISVFPATGFIETLLAAARQIYPEGTVELRDLDIVRPLVFEDDESYETLVRIAPETGLVEFRSRERREGRDWLLNARCIIGRSPVDSEPAGDVPEGSANVLIPQARVYQNSEGLGFTYGPAFRRVRHCHFPDPEVGVAALEPIDRFVLDNAICDLTGFDAAFHTLFAAEEAGVSEIPLKRMLPVRFGLIRAFVSGGKATRAIARTVRRSATSILTNIELLDEAGTVVLSARGVRLVDAPIAAGVDAKLIAYTSMAWRMNRAGERCDLASMPAPSLIGSAFAGSMAEATLLLEAAALRATWSAFKQTRKSEQDVAKATHLHSALLWHLESAGLATEKSGFRVLSETCELPELASVVRSILVRHPTLAGEASMLSRIGETIGRLLAGDANAQIELTSTHWRQLGAAAAQISALRESVTERLAAYLAASPRNQLLRLLVIGADQALIVRELAGRFGNLDIIVTDLDSERLDLARAGLVEDVQRLRFVPWNQLEDLTRGMVDIACAIDALSEIAASREGLARLQRLMRPNAVLLAGELAPNVFWDLVRGARTEWWTRSATPQFPVGALLTSREWLDELQGAGFTSVSVDPMMGEERIGLVLRGQARGETAAAAQPSGIVGFAWQSDVLAETAKLRALLPEAAELPPTDIVWSIDGRGEALRSPADQASFLSDLLARIAQKFRALAPLPARLWIVVDFGDEDRPAEPLQRPLWCAVTAAIRVARNEYPGFEIRCIGFAEKVSHNRIAQEMATPSDEQEIFFQADKRLVFRAERGIPPLTKVRGHDTALRLATRSGTGRGPIGWTETPRRHPGADEVEIEVAATGLNFRDVMWNLGLLPEEALEDGYAGATLGMECAGKVCAVGSDVQGLRVGDAVAAFASGAFASHVIAPAFAVTRLPHHLTYEAAATLPVAFLTAYYSLVHLAQLRSGEIVLIHGGAGAVGLAALQVAKLRGARIIATAGSAEKRALLRNLGADIVLNSRTLQFADQVLTYTGGKGVDVVLNSLAGEAMIRSLDCLGSQGRFIELGKRDFYSNTHLGLRPFRRNLSYFGVDIDQLIGEQRELMQRLFKEIVNLFATETFVPLPHRAFAGETIADAFRHMQRAGHIGKIVVNPAKRETAASQLTDRFPISSDGLHIVIGGTRGFGLATAEWLVDKGAAHLALISRSGIVPADASDKIEALRRRGIAIEIAAVDVTDEIALGNFIRRANARRPILGLIHAAMILEDRLIDGMDYSAIEIAVLPKVIGALNLERLAKDLKLDYLLLYSSATTLLGNPGQFNYVAANGFLEGLARRARAAGLPVLAVAWGGIQDAGYLAKNIGSNASLRKKFASSVIQARHALDALAQVYDRVEGCIALAKIDWSVARRDLMTVRGPAFDAMVVTGGGRQGADNAAVLEKLKSLPVDQATEALADIVVEEIARVLRLSPKEVDRHRPLAEIGMDSLMMLELRITVEETLQIDLPMMSLANGTSPSDVAHKIAPLLFGDPRKEALPGSLAAMASSHFVGEAETTSVGDREKAALSVLERARTMEGRL